MSKNKIKNKETLASPKKEQILLRRILAAVIIGAIFVLMFTLGRGGGASSGVDKSSYRIPSPSPTIDSSQKLTTCRFENCGEKVMTKDQCSEARCCRVGSSYVITEDSESCQKLVAEFAAKKAPSRVTAPTIQNDTPRSVPSTINLEQYDTSNSVDDRCQREMAEYSTCLSEYNAKMADYNSCVTNYTYQGIGNAQYICSKPFNTCSKPFGCGIF